MSVLNKKAIMKYLSEPVTSPYSLRLTPLLEPDDQIKEDAIDIRLGSYFLVPRGEKNGLFTPNKTPSQHMAHRLHIPPGRAVVLPAKGVILASAFEYLKMPCNLTAQVLTRSSIGRIFITTATATLVHPLYRGCLTLEIVNLGNTPIELDILSRIAQLQFFRTTNHEQLKEDTVLGRYSAAIEPEFATFDSDKKEYAKIRSLMPSVTRSGE